MTQGLQSVFTVYDVVSLQNRPSPLSAVVNFSSAVFLALPYIAVSAAAGRGSTLSTAGEVTDWSVDVRTASVLDRQAAAARTSETDIQAAPPPRIFDADTSFQTVSQCFGTPAPTQSDRPYVDDRTRYVTTSSSFCEQIGCYRQRRKPRFRD